MNLFNRKKDKRKKPRIELKTRTKFTIIAIINLIWYTVIVLIASFCDHTVPSELTVAWFSAWTVELALLFGIKIQSKDDLSNYKDKEQKSELIPEPQDESSVQDDDCVG